MVHELQIPSGHAVLRRNLMELRLHCVIWFKMIKWAFFDWSNKHGGSRHQKLFVHHNLLSLTCYNVYLPVSIIYMVKDNYKLRFWYTRFSLLYKGLFNCFSHQYVYSLLNIRHHLTLYWTCETSYAIGRHGNKFAYRI